MTAYASMQPWEDFAETFAVYLDLAALLDTAVKTGLIEHVDLRGDLTVLVDHYRRLGIAVNEMNREMGLLDPAPFVFSDPVLKKLHFIHQLSPAGI